MTKKIDDCNEGAIEKYTHSLPYANSRLGPSIDLVDIAKEISQADAMLTTQVNARLSTIVDQIRHLQNEARLILEQSQQDHWLHRAECNFKRIPGKIYHLYQKSNNKVYFSMLSPSDWNSTPPHKYIGSYRLETDMSWTPREDIENVDNQKQIVKRFLLDSDNK